MFVFTISLIDICFHSVRAPLPAAAKTHWNFILKLVVFLTLASFNVGLFEICFFFLLLLFFYRNCRFKFISEHTCCSARSSFNRNARLLLSIQFEWIMTGSFQNKTPFQFEIHIACDQNMTSFSSKCLLFRDAWKYQHFLNAIYFNILADAQTKALI